MINFKDSTKELLRKIEELFDTKFAGEGASYSLQLINDKDNSKIHVEVIPEIEEGDEGSYLISVYTNNCHLQLQSCNRFIVSKMLEEVIFVSETEQNISGLIISKQGDCALYSNVDKKLLNSDFDNLNSEKLLSAVALSITESA